MVKQDKEFPESQMEYLKAEPNTEIKEVCREEIHMGSWVISKKKG